MVNPSIHKGLSQNIPTLRQTLFSNSGGAVRSLICVSAATIIAAMTSARLLFVLCIGQLYTFNCDLFYLLTLAPPPDMSDSTSFSEAIVVSPGVVIARAP